MTDWMDAAACRGHDPELWHSNDTTERDLARAVCDRCPVRRECGDYADSIGAEGVWGGEWRDNNRKPLLLIDVLALIEQHGSVRAAEAATRRNLYAAAGRIVDIGWWQPGDGWNPGSVTDAGRQALDRRARGEDVITDREFTRRSREDTVAEFLYTHDEHGGDLAIAAARLDMTIEALEQALVRASKAGTTIHRTRLDRWTGTRVRTA